MGNFGFCRLELDLLDCKARCAHRRCRCLYFCSIAAGFGQFAWEEESEDE